MTTRTNRITDEQLSRYAIRGTAAVMAAAIPVCLVALPAIGVLHRLYIAVFSALLLMMVAALAVGIAREAMRFGRYVRVVRRMQVRRHRSDDVTTPRATPVAA
jgi:hypothetical protein